MHLIRSHVPRFLNGFLVPDEHTISEGNVAPIGHFILIPNQAVFVLTRSYYVLSRETTNTNFIVFLVDLTDDCDHDLPQSMREN